MKLIILEKIYNCRKDTRQKRRRRSVKTKIYYGTDNFQTTLRQFQRYIYICVCVFSFVRQKMNDERNLIWCLSVCACVRVKQFFFLRGRKQEKTLVFFPFFFFFTRAPFWVFFLKHQTSMPQMLQISHTRYISFSTGNKRSSALKTRESIVLLVWLKKDMVLER